MIDPVYRNYLKKLSPYFRPDIKEVVMNKPEEIWLENEEGEWIKTRDVELNITWCEGMAKAMAAFSGQKFSREFPTLSFKIPKFGVKPEEQGGHRVQIFHGAICSNNFAMAIRLHRNKVFTIDDYKISEKNKENIIQQVKQRKNILISGGTSTGKTSFLNLLLKFIPLEERLITIEGVSELIIPQQNYSSLFYSENNSGGKNVSDLLNDSLRMRPDRIIMGELRKENSFVFARAINTGHEGSIATIHANSPLEAIEAMVDNVILNGDVAEDAVSIFNKQLRKRISVVIQLKRESGKIFAYCEEIK